MKTATCPTCEGELKLQTLQKSQTSQNGQAPQNGKDTYQCTECQESFIEYVPCPDCEAEMDVMKACGAVNYFCPKCNELKSKSRAVAQYRPL
ncbi:MAG: zinc-ribbon domain-containing protein [Vibrio sp.]